MKFIHTSDWHLGKYFHGLPLLEDQAYFLSQIMQELSAAQKSGAPYDALIVSGDIYDRPVPPAEAVTILDDFLTQVHTTFPDLHIFLIAGNHDGAERLSFGIQFFEAHNVHITCFTDHFETPVIVKDTAVYQLPFLYAGSIKSTDRAPDGQEILLRHQADLWKEAVRRIEETHSKNYNGLQTLLNAHLFLSGAPVQSSEVTFIGTAEQVDPSIFKNFDYVAAGHLHGKTHIAQNCWYPSAPLCYDFAEAKREKCILSVDLTGGNAQVTPIPIQPLRECVLLKGSLQDLLQQKDGEDLSHCFVFALCTDKTPNPHAKQMLRERYKYPAVLELMYETTVEAETPSQTLSERKTMLASGSLEETFCAFLETLYGKEEVSKNTDIQEEKALFAQYAYMYKDVEEHQIEAD